MSDIIFEEWPASTFGKPPKVIELYAYLADTQGERGLVKVSAAIGTNRTILIVFAGRGFAHNRILYDTMKNLPGFEAQWVGGNMIVCPCSSPRWDEKSFSLQNDLTPEIKELAMAEFKRRYEAYKKGEKP